MMPKVSTRDTLLGQWEIIQLLTHGRTWKINLAIFHEAHEQGCTVTKQTVECNLKMLYESFLLQIEPKLIGKSWEWRWSYGAFSNVSSI